MLRPFELIRYESTVVRHLVPSLARVSRASPVIPPAEQETVRVVLGMSVAAMAVGSRSVVADAGAAAQSKLAIVRTDVVVRSILMFFTCEICHTRRCWGKRSMEVSGCSVGV